MTDADDIIAAFERRVIADLQQAVEDADAIAHIVTLAADAIRRDWAGNRLYIKATDRTKRDRQILSEWRQQKAAGRENREQLARQHGVHRTTVDRIIARHLSRSTRTGFGSADWNL